MINVGGEARYEGARPGEGGRKRGIREKGWWLWIQSFF